VKGALRRLPLSPDRPPILTLGAGPVDAYPEVLRALSEPLGYDRDSYFLGRFERTARKAAEALGTQSPPLILQGEAVLGLEAAAASLIAAEDVVLNLASGEFGKGFGYWAARYCGELREIEVPYDQAIDPEAVRAELEAHPEIAVVALCHHETPTGTINPLAEIAALCRARGVLTIVDAVSSWAGMPIEVEACGDLFVTGPNKALGGTPGLTLVHVSEAAWAKIDANPKAPFASMLSLKDWREAWRAERPFPFTPSISEVYALEAALDRYLAEGPEAVWARHALTAAACRAGVGALGLSLWPAREAIASPTCTAVRLPEGIEEAALLARARADYGIRFSGGPGSLPNRLIRIGHLGPTAQPIYATLAVTALGGALRALGRPADVGAGVEAALAVIDGAGTA